jgi:hypothetical protein
MHIQWPYHFTKSYFYLYLLGQKCVLHGSERIFCPLQSAPLFWGAGFVHDLYRSREPPAHVAEHLLHADQSFQPPSTIINQSESFKVSNYLLFLSFVSRISSLNCNEEFEDIKVVIRIRISKKNRQHNGQKYKGTNNDLQNIHIKLKIK